MKEANSEKKKEEAEGSTSFFVKLLQNHYTTTPRIKSPEQISRESWLIPKLIPFNRWFLMPAAFVVQFCCGSLYSWSIFNRPIDYLIYGSDAHMAPITFYIAVGFLGLSAALMGPWLERNGPRTASHLGGLMFCIGNIITAVALYVKEIWLVYLGDGVIAGYGIGICYISPVSSLQKWFPDKRGLASGIAVSGFGAGSIASAKIKVILIEHLGLPMTFILMGVVYFICIFISGLVLRTPPPGFSPEKDEDEKAEKEKETKEVETGGVTFKDFPSPGSDAKMEEKREWTLLEALASPDFRLMYIMFFSNILFGLVAISRLSNMITDVFGESTDLASTVVAINGGFNLSGRLFFSLLSDYIGRKNAYVMMLTCQLIILGGFYFITTTRTYWLFLGTMWIIGACYGGGFACIPAFLTDKFGSGNIGACHGVILTAWSLARIVGGVVFTTVFKVASEGRELSDPFPYIVNVWWMVGIVVVGWIALLFVKPTERDRKINRLLRLPSF